MCAWMRAFESIRGGGAEGTSGGGSLAQQAAFDAGQHGDDDVRPRLCCVAWGTARHASPILRNPLPTTAQCQVLPAELVNPFSPGCPHQDTPWHNAACARFAMLCPRAAATTISIALVRGPTSTLELPVRAAAPGPSGLPTHLHAGPAVPRRAGFWVGVWGGCAADPHNRLAVGRDTTVLLQRVQDCL